MAEAQVSVDGVTRALPSPFVVIATDNPIEYEGTYTLPEAQLDRFLLRVRMGYLPVADEAAMLRRRLDRAAPEAVLKAHSDPTEVLAMRASLERVEIDDDLVDYIVALIDATRKHAADPGRRLPARRPGAGPTGARPRGDAPPATTSPRRTSRPSRCPRWRTGSRLRPELWVRRISSDDVIAGLVDSVATPRTTPRTA